MAKKVNISSPAFPVGQKSEFKGMTLRDYFAAQALKGLLASGIMVAKKDVVATAFEYADFMLRERLNEEKKNE